MAEAQAHHWRLRPNLRIPATLVLFAAAMIAVWVRSPPPPVVDAQKIAALRVPAGSIGQEFRAGLGPFRLAGAWRLKSPHSEFNSLSGIDILPDGRLIAVSDRGARAILPTPGNDAKAWIGGTDIGNAHVFAIRDLEAVTVDPATGNYWIAIENFNGIARFSAGAAAAPFVQPEIMRRWPPNRGPETLLRLADGRFIAISEGRSAGSEGSFPALLFDGDPLSAPPPRLFHVAMPGGFRPVDAGQLPDGRVLILGRRFGLLTGFSGIIAIADPAEIRWGGLWRARVIARLGGGPLADNYEGLAVQPRANGGAIVWLVSDDNMGQIVQQTFLLKLVM